MSKKIFTNLDFMYNEAYHFRLKCVNTHDTTDSAVATMENYFPADSEGSSVGLMVYDTNGDKILYRDQSGNIKKVATEDFANNTYLSKNDSNVTKWNTSATWTTNNGANVLAHLANGAIHVSSTQVNAWNNKQDYIGEVATVKAQIANGVTAYNWGDHSAEKYAKIYKANPIDARELKEATQAGRVNNDPFVQTSWHSEIGLVFDSVIGIMIRAKLGGNVVFYKNWADSAISDNYGIGSAKYYTEGVCVCSGSNIYRYTGTSWVEIYSGADSSLADDVNTLKEMLTVGDTTKEVIDTWEEVRNFLNEFDTTEDLATKLQKMNSEIEKKATKGTTLSAYGITDALKAPVQVGVTAGDRLVYTSNGPLWNKGKHVQQFLMSSHDSNVFNVTIPNSLYVTGEATTNPMFSVHIYVSNDSYNYEEIIGDVDIQVNNKKVVVTLSAKPAYKVVTIVVHRL